MDLETIVCRIAEAVPHVDGSTTSQRSSRRTGQAYLQGAKSLNEPQFVKEVAHWWSQTYPAELPTFSNRHLEVIYPDAIRSNCDLVICDPQAGATDYEWAVEIKLIALVGDNGKNNDYGLQKLLSPYLKDRSLIHDAQRLRVTSLGSRRAVVMYGFDYDASAVERARIACQRLGLDDQIATNLRRVLRSVDPETFEFRLDALVEIADAYLRRLGLVSEPLQMHRFTGADRHPCGGEGLVAGWEITTARN